MGLGSEFANKGNQRPARTFAIAIAISDYKHGWDNLNFPVSDCVRFLKVLSEKYGIIPYCDPLFNEDATGEKIVNTLWSLSRQDESNERVITPDDNLIIIFSGHGYLDPEDVIPLGHFVPFDGIKNPKPSELKKLINGDELVRLLSKVWARQVLIIVDTCYSSAFANRKIELHSEISKICKGNSPFNPSRHILTSGRLDEVPDKSEFMDALCCHLEGNDQPIVSIAGINGMMEERFRQNKQKPHSVNLVHEQYAGGGFNFYLVNAFLKIKNVASLPESDDDFIQLLRKKSETFRQKLLLKGRFKHVKIENILLANTSLKVRTEPLVKLKKEDTSLLFSITKLWTEAVPHGILLGSGGMGKTSSILHIWEKFLEDKEFPLPIFIALNEYNNAIGEHREYFISRYIAKHYLGEEFINKETLNRIWNLFKKDRTHQQPEVLLLLDGFNEVTAESEPLTKELYKLSMETDNLQLLVSSRHIETQNYSWAREAHLLELVPLADQTITDFLDQLGIQPNEKLLKLFGNPMMLTLFSGTEHFSKDFNTDSRFTFLPVQTEAELLWNFREAQLAKSHREEGNEDDRVYTTFLLRFLVPYIAWGMEKEGMFFIPLNYEEDQKFNFYTLITDACKKLREQGSLRIIPDLKRLGKKISLQDLEFISELERAEDIKNYLINHLSILVQEGTDLRFLHQNFRDFYAACHLRNCIRFGLAEGKRPEEWKERTFPVYLRRMIGELEGEYIFDAQKLLRGEEIPSRIKESLFSRLTDSLRKVDMNGDYTVWNIVAILHEVRNTLAGTDLRMLDLRGFIFYDVSLIAFRGTKYLTANLEGAKVNSRQFGFNGHRGGVNSLCFSEDGSKFLSASNDTTVKEWNVFTGDCLRTFFDHSKAVNSAIYSPDQKRMLSTSRDRSVKEWEISTGLCVNTLNEHRKSVFSAVYHYMEPIILSASWDGTVREWNSTLGGQTKIVIRKIGQIQSASYDPLCERILINPGGVEIEEWSKTKNDWLQPLSGHLDYINFVTYDKEGKYIVSASRDGTIKLWSVSDRKCQRSFDAHSGGVNSVNFNPKGNRIISTYNDGLIKEWSISFEKPIRIIFAGRKKIRINYALYSPSGDTILTAAEDGTIKVWEADSWECLKVFHGRKITVTIAQYSSDGKRILAGYSDGSVREFSTYSRKGLRTLFKVRGEINSIGYSIEEHHVVVITDNQTISIWSVLSGKLNWTGSVHSKKLSSAVYQHRERKVLAISADGIVYEWFLDIHGVISCKEAKITSENVSDVAYSADSNSILVASLDGYIDEISYEQKNQIRRIKIDSERQFSIKISYDSKRIIVSSTLSKFKVWSLADRKQIDEFIVPDSSYFAGAYNEKKAYCLSHSFESDCLHEWSIKERKLIGKYFMDHGHFLQSLDFRHLHPDSEIREIDRFELLHSGAIFDDQDEKEWKEAVEDAYGDMEE